VAGTGLAGESTVAKRIGSEKAKRAEKIIDRALAEQVGLILDYAGPLTKTDAWKVLAKLIGNSNATPAAFTAKTTFGELAREYVDGQRTGWLPQVIDLMELAEGLEPPTL
jgi:hypothetical protein